MRSRRRRHVDVLAAKRTRAFQRFVRAHPQALQRGGCDQESARPVIVADRGAAICDAREALEKLASRIPAPVVVTLDAKTSCSRSALFAAASVSTDWLREPRRREADLVIFAGSTPIDHTRQLENAAAGNAIVHIDLDPVRSTQLFDTIGIQPTCGPRSTALAVRWNQRNARMARAHQRLRRRMALRGEKARESDQFRCGRRHLQRAHRSAAERAIVVADPVCRFVDGDAAVFAPPEARYFRAAGSLGWSFPASLGAKCAAPDKPVICFCGDGGFYYHFPELETARRRDIKTITIVNNNHCLSQGLRNLNIAYQGRADQSRKGECFEYRETDFAALARDLDCAGYTVEKPQDFSKAFTEAMASKLPAVIDCKTDFAVQAPHLGCLRDASR